MGSKVYNATHVADGATLAQHKLAGETEGAEYNVLLLAVETRVVGLTAPLSPLLLSNLPTWGTPMSKLPYLRLPISECDDGCRGLTGLARQAKWQDASKARRWTATVSVAVAIGISRVKEEENWEEKEEEEARQVFTFHPVTLPARCRAMMDMTLHHSTDLQ